MLGAAVATPTAIFLVVGGAALLLLSGRFTDWTIEWNRRFPWVLDAFGGERVARFFSRLVVVVIGLLWLAVGIAALVR